MTKFLENLLLTSFEEEREWRRSKREMRRERQTRENRNKTKTRKPLPLRRGFLRRAPLRTCKMPHKLNNGWLSNRGRNIDRHTQRREEEEGGGRGERERVWKEGWGEEREIGIQT